MNFQIQRMLQSKQGFWVVIISFLLLTACSSTRQVSKSTSGTQTNKSATKTPWYKQAGNFETGQDSYTATATSLSSDSTRALYKAEQTAMADLRSGMQEQLEQLRRQLVNQDVNVAGRPDFIWLVRGAIPANLDKAEKVRNQVLVDNGIYQAYVEIRYSKQNLADDLIHVLSANSDYASAVRNSTAFKNWMSSQENDTTKTTE